MYFLVLGNIVLNDAFDPGSRSPVQEEARASVFARGNEALACARSLAEVDFQGHKNMGTQTLGSDDIRTFCIWIPSASVPSVFQTLMRAKF